MASEEIGPFIPVTADEVEQVVRAILEALVERRAEDLGSRMQAYASVASAIGRSASWVRRLTGGSTGIAIGWHDWRNIETECARRKVDARAITRTVNARIADDLERIDRGREREKGR